MITITQWISQFAAPCNGGDFLGFPKWYKYLDSQTVSNTLGGGSCAPKIDSLNDIWLVLAAVVEMLLRIGSLFAIAYVIYGSIQFITSQGDPAKTQTARSTIFNALIGLVISIAAATIVSYVAGGFK